MFGELKPVSYNVTSLTQLQPTQPTLIYLTYAEHNECDNTYSQLCNKIPIMQLCIYYLGS